MTITFEDFKQIVIDRYTGEEIAERLKLSPEELLDSFSEELYNNMEAFYEVFEDLGGSLDQIKDTQDNSAETQELYS